jgi:hypothetical protein
MVPSRPHRTVSHAHIDSAGATKAFQMLTSAFESLSAPEPPAAPGKGKASGPSVGRSNEGCYRTKVT